MIKWGKIFNIQKKRRQKKINKRQIEKKWEYGTLNPNISSNSKHK